ncbi:ABC transporter substrate-binding protein [Bacillus sp. 1P02SD]|uniref:ABC transporter substrate-binding protein n=1 Tax=Bacillus sp. 1P02SD TaxID=3132264 RepID=UPI0039A172FE
MKMLKRLMVLSIALMVILAGCSSGSTNGDKQKESNGVTELTYWVPFSGSDGEFMEAMVKKFNESQDEVKVQFMNNKSENYYTKLKTALVSNSAPDVAIAHVSRFSELLPTGKVEALDELASEAGLDWSTYGENQVEAVIRDGKHYAVPLDSHAVIMYYNKKYLGDAGLLNEDGTIKMEPGVDGFTKMLQTLKVELPSDVSPMVIGSNNVFTFWIWYALVQQQGGTYFKDGKPTIDTPESKKAMELMQTWLNEDLMPADIGVNSYDIFKTEKAAVTFTGVWATGNFELNESLDFAAVSFPQLFDQPAAWGDSHTLIIPKQDNKEKQIAGVKFADWLAENGAMWAKAGHVPSKPSVQDTEEYKALKFRADYANIMEIVKYMPDSKVLTAVNEAVQQSLVEINYGNLTIEEGLKKAQENAEKLVNK